MIMENFHCFNLRENNIVFCDIDLDTVLKASDMVIQTYVGIKMCLKQIRRIK